MVRALLLLRLKQAYRVIVDIGLFRVLFVIGLITFLGFALYAKSSDKSTAQFISCGFLSIIMLVHVKREDTLFLKSHFSNYKILIFSEYIVLSVPVIYCLIMHKQWIALCELSALIIIINLDVKTRHLRLNTRLQDLIPPDAIEWKAGARKYLLVIIPVWVVAMLTSFFTGSVPIAIFVLGVISLSFFEKNEPCQVLLSYELSPKELLSLKIKRQLQLFSIIIVPLVVSFLLFHLEIWYIPVVLFSLFCILNVYVVVTKYAFYEPNTRSAAAQTFLVTGVLGIIIPLFLPLVLLLGIKFYRKSINNLNFYLDDFNQ